MTKHSTIATLACLLGLSLAAANAHAGPTLIVTGGILQGAKGVLVNGQLYDVTFANGTCAAVFSGCDDVSDFQFTTLVAATAASHALKDQVFLNGPLGFFDTDPTKTNGCTFGVGGTYCYVITPYAPNPTSVPPTVAASFFTNDIPEGNDGVGKTPGMAALITPHITVTEDATYAKFTQVGGTINVTTNLNSATFDIVGPASYSGSGTSFSQSDAPAGEYTITYGHVSHHVTAPSETKALTAGDSITFSGTYQKPDLKVSSITPIQVVPGSDINQDGTIDLVLNKPTVVLAQLEITNQLAFEAADLITTGLYAHGLPMTFVTKSFANLAANGFRIDLYFTPQFNGSVSLRVAVDPDNLIPEENNENNDRPLGVAVTPTSSLYIAYLAVPCGGSVPLYSETAKAASDYILAQYPIAPAQFTYRRLDSSLGICIHHRSWDLVNLYIQGQLLTAFTADRVIGIASDDYMDSTFGTSPYRWHGYNPCGTKMGFVRDGRWDVGAHELGHSFRLSHPGEPEDDCSLAGASHQSSGGFWVQSPLENHRAIGMLQSLMSVGIDNAPTPFMPEQWITVRDYERVFSAMATDDPADPEILLVAGILHRNGPVEFAPLYRSPDGIPNAIGDGKISVEVLGLLDQVVSRTSFDVSFRDVIEVPGSPEDVDSVPFGVKVAYPSNAVAVRIVEGGRILGRTVIASTLLRDAVTSIPDHGFVKNSSQRRKALLNKVDAFEKQLAAGTSGADNKLQNDIRKHLDEWLINRYPTETPLQYTKEQILGLVDELLERLDP